MIWLYRLLFIPGLLVALPTYLARMLRRGGYRQDWHHRFGFLPKLPASPPGVTRFWIQAVSVGEINALPPLLKAIQQRIAAEFVITTTTSTGYGILRGKLAAECRATGYFPLDAWPTSALAWKRLQPDVILLLEGEIWPEHLRQAHVHGVPVALVNARMSDRSFRRYQRLRPAARWLLGHLDAVLCASEPDADRFRQLLPDPPRVRVTGNLKADLAMPERLTADERRALHAEMGFPNDVPVLAGLSTWPGEEAFLYERLQHCQRSGQDVRLLLIPRHAERRASLISWLESTGETFAVRSKGVTKNPDNRIYLADTTGEMARLMQVADVAFIGKSLPPNTGGQTPLEAAALGVPIVHGPNMNNFRAITTGLAAAGGARSGADAAVVAEQLHNLLCDPALQQAQAAAAEAWLQAQRGAADRTATVIIERIQPPQAG